MLLARPGRVGLTIAVLIGLLSACSPRRGTLALSLYGFNPRNFTQSANITNQWFPLTPGTRIITHGTVRGIPQVVDGLVTAQTRLVDGVMTRMVDDKDIDNGQLVEETNDFYAQDVQGDVWYMGEITTHYVNGHLTDHADTWFGGQKRAKPGVIMLATPQIGSVYQQESAPNLAIDRGRVVAFNESLCVPMRCFSGVMQIEETARLDPGVIEEKYYESGVGVIKSVIVQGDPEEQDLVSVTPPS